MTATLPGGLTWGPRCRAVPSGTGPGKRTTSSFRTGRATRYSVHWPSVAVSGERCPFTETAEGAAPRTSRATASTGQEADARTLVV